MSYIEAVNAKSGGSLDIALVNAAWGAGLGVINWKFASGAWRDFTIVRKLANGALSNHGVYNKFFRIGKVVGFALAPVVALCTSLREVSVTEDANRRALQGRGLKGRLLKMEPMAGIHKWVEKFGKFGALLMFVGSCSLGVFLMRIRCLRTLFSAYNGLLMPISGGWTAGCLVGAIATFNQDVADPPSFLMS